MALEHPLITRMSSGMGEPIKLVRRSGHRTSHLLARRILRLNDGWCGKCGADLHYLPVTARADAVVGKVVPIVEKERP